MFHLLAGIYDSFFKIDEYKLLILGLDGAGKTAVLERLRYHIKQKASASAGDSNGVMLDSTGGLRLEDGSKSKRGSSKGRTPEKEGLSGLASISAQLKATSSSSGAASGVGPAPGLGITASTAGPATTTVVSSSSSSAPLPSRQRSPINTDVIRPTIGLNIARLEVLKHPTLVWDMGGRESLRSLWFNYTHQCHAVIFVIDASDGARFPEVKKVAVDLLSHPSLEGVPFVIMLNKMDLLVESVVKHCEEKAHQVADQGLPLKSGNLRSDRPPESCSTANILSDIGILDALVDQMERQRRSGRKELEFAGDETAPSASLRKPPLSISAELTRSVGVGERLLRVMAVSALHEELLPVDDGSRTGRSNSTWLEQLPCSAAGREAVNRVKECLSVEPVHVGVEWIVRYLQPNARHVEAL
jgi:GTPase SAR1 family protein